MKNRRNAFKARLNKKDKKDKMPEAKVNTTTEGNKDKTGLDNDVPQSYNPNNYPTPKPFSRYHRANLNSQAPAPVELEAEPVAMKTVPELISSATSPWSPDSHSDSPSTPDNAATTTTHTTTTIRPKEIYTSREYRHQPKPRRPTDFSKILHLPGDDADGELDVTVLDIGTPGGFEEDFVDTLIAQLEAAAIGERATSQ
jgi:hypothetical protein